MTDPDTTPDPASITTTLLQAALPHVAFDGWSEATFVAAARDAGIDLPVARSVCPRGAVDLAVAFHKQGDDEMVSRLKAASLGELKFRDQVALAVRLRLEAVEDREAVRRGSALFSLPHLAPVGARLIWGTADTIWTTLGDTSDDLNWYTKRATLAAVYGATVLYWLGDDSAGRQATWEFLDRRIGDVMQIEKAKAGVQKNPVLRTLFAGPTWVASKVRPPDRMPRMDLPGRFTGRGGA